MNKNIQKILTVIIILTVSFVAGIIISRSDSTGDVEVITGKTVPETPRIVVGVSGMANDCGKYSVPVGSTVHEILYRAGGVKENADLSVLDLDRVVTEPCTIDVPEASPVREAKEESFPLNINTADAEALSALPGIGDNTAAGIINYRELHNGFKTTEEIMNVKGIGEAKYEAIKDLITVGGE